MQLLICFSYMYIAKPREIVPNFNWEIEVNTSDIIVTAFEKLIKWKYLIWKKGKKNFFLIPTVSANYIVTLTYLSNTIR